MSEFKGLDITRAGASIAGLLVSLSPPSSPPGAIVLPVLVEALTTMLVQVDDAECDRLMRAFIEQVARRRMMAVRGSPILKPGGAH